MAAQLIAAVRHYGLPAWARSQNPRSDIWPPISKGLDSFCADTSPDDSAISGLHVSTTKKTSLPCDYLGAPPVPNPITVTDELRQKLDRLTIAKETLYHPLHDGETIRILELHPGEPAEPLRCDFHYADLHRLHLRFEALSYVWGNRDDERDISVHCNGYKRIITPNLDDALRHIRKQSHSIFLWADALCMNQDDSRERSHQVTLMGSIYRSASRVLIWVGGPINGTFWYEDGTKCKAAPWPSGLEDVRAQRSFGAICDIVNRWRDGDEKTPEASYTIRSQSGHNQTERYSTFEQTPSTFTKHDDGGAMRQAMASYYARRSKRKKQRPPPGADSGIDSIPEAAPDSHFWMSIGDFFEQPWFWRVWVIQEVVLAKSAVVLCANAEIDWRWVGLAAAILRTSYHGVCESLQLGGVYNAYLMYRMSKMSDLPSPGLSFVELLRLTRQFDATDPRDRMYGLLGMRASDNDPITDSLFVAPDYTIAEAELWKRFAWKAINATNDLSILSSVQTQTIPSWVPQWEKVCRTTLAPWDTGETFAVSEGFPLHLQHDSNTMPDALQIRGIQVGTIGYQTKSMWLAIDTSLLVSKHLSPFFASEQGLRLLAQTLTAGRSAYGSLVNSSEVIRNFSAYILALHEHYLAQKRETGSEGNRAYDDSHMLELWNYAEYDFHEKKQNFQKVFDLHPGLKHKLQKWAAAGDAFGFHESAAAMCRRRRLFLTVNGFLGLGPDSAKEGDSVVVLSGGHVPFVLRQQPRTQTIPSYEIDSDAIDAQALDREYTLVGECYVEGLMKGEAVRAAEVGEHVSGPVSVDLVLREIVRVANEPEEIDEMMTDRVKERVREKMQRLERGDLFTVEMLEEQARVMAVKRELKII